MKSKAKSADAFRTISEVAHALNTQPHVLRFWESKFSQVKPVKRAGGRRYYRPVDMALLAGIKKLLHDDGVTIKGVQKVLRERGVKYVSALTDAAPTAPEAPKVEDTTVVAFAAPDAPVETTGLTRLRLAVSTNATRPTDDLAPVLARLKALHGKMIAQAPAW